MRVLRNFVALILFVTQATWAGGVQKPSAKKAQLMTSEQYLESVTARLESSKSFQEFVHKSDEIPNSIKDQVYAWLKENNLTQYKFKKITARVTDLTIVDKSGREAKLTLTDVKRGRLHINNKLVSYDQKKSISENLTQFTKIAAPHQVAANFLLRPTLTTPILVIFGFVPQLTSRAEAYGVLGVAAAIGVVGLAAGLYFDFFASSEAQASEIQDLIQSAGYKPNVKIECSAFFNSDSQLPDSVSLDLTKNDNSKVNYLISTKTSDFRVTPAEWADKDGFSFDDRQTLIDKTKSCCKTAGCMNLANGTTGFSSPHGTSGTNNKKPASHGAGSIK